MSNKVITDIETLKNLSQTGLDCYVLLEGRLRSSKYIQWVDDENRYCVFNEIDDSQEFITKNELLNSIIGQAMKKNALIAY